MLFRSLYIMIIKDFKDNITIESLPRVVNQPVRMSLTPCLEIAVLELYI